jgi:hypothetical protein
MVNILPHPSPGWPLETLVVLVVEVRGHDDLSARPRQDAVGGWGEA